MRHHVWNSLLRYTSFEQLKLSLDSFNRIIHFLLQNYTLFLIFILFTIILSNLLKGFVEPFII